MKHPKAAIGMRNKLLRKAHRHRALIATLLFLSIVSASSRYFLGASLLGGSSSDDGTSSSAGTDPRTCTSVDTVFQDLTTVKEATDRFQQFASRVVSEREEYFSKPSQWSCLSESDGGSGPAIPALRALADRLPGWKYRSAFGSIASRPVTFTSFTSVLGEFQREYECKLAEFLNSADAMVAQNLDLDDPKSYCCDSNYHCVQATSDIYCLTGTFEDSQCRENPDDPSTAACPTGNTHEVFATRLGKFRSRIESEKQRARTAMLKTIHALRSFETNYAYAKQLVCFQRASLDLKNELSLLADATSCMPKIWDAVTSLHDRDSSLKP